MENIKKEVLENIEKISTDLYKKAWENRINHISYSTYNENADNFVSISKDEMISCDISILAFPVVG